MASATISSSSYFPFETKSNNVRDDSFSTYLALIRQSFSTEHANPSSSPSSFKTIAEPTKPTSMDDNTEIDVFAAEKYFSGCLDVQDYLELLTSSNSCSSSSKNKKRSTTTKPRSSTCSDTSTNSHSILLGRSSRQKQQPSAAARRRSSFLDVFRCCSKKNVVKDDAADCSKLPPTTAVLQSKSSSDLFEIESESVSIGSQYPIVYEPSEASIEWSVATASMANLSVVTSSASAGEGKVRRRSTSGHLTFGCASGKAVSVKPDKVGALERYHVMMDLAGSASVAGTVAAARPRRASLG